MELCNQLTPQDTTAGGQDDEEIEDETFKEAMKRSVNVQGNFDNVHKERLAKRYEVQI